MKKLTLLLLFVTTIVACKKQESLQEYLINTQEKQNFIRLDLSTTLLTSYFEEAASNSDKEVFTSIKKMNIAFLPQKKATSEEIKIERERLQKVMENTDYKALIKINDKRGKGTIFYAGKPDAINEIVAMAYSKDFGVGVARILGENMQPTKIMQMLKEAKIDKNNKDLVKLKDIFADEFKTEKLKVEPKK